MSDYHTPPSLKWLINIRTRQHGHFLSLQAKLAEQIKYCELEVETAQRALFKATEQLENLRKDGEAKLQAIRNGLDAIDTTISFHEIKIDPTKLKPIKSQPIGRQEPYGAMTRGIFSAFRLARGRSLTTTEIAVSIITNEHMMIPEVAFPKFRWRVRHRLKCLCREGKVTRLHEAKTQCEGRWSLPE